MRILAISDTHGQADLEALAQLAEPADLVVHLGDGFQDGQWLQAGTRTPVIQVVGNADQPLEGMREKIIEVEGWTILLTHGDRFGVKGGLEKLEAHGRALGAQVILFGHLHQPRRIDREGLVLLNPGSAWRNYDGSPPSVLGLEVTDEGLEVEWLPLATSGRGAGLP